jgi:hypothetical protein
LGTLSGILRSGVVGQRTEGRAHHGRSGDLAEGAQVRQAGRAVAALEHHRPTQRRQRLDRLAHLARLDQRRRQIAFGLIEAHAQQPRQHVARLGKGPGPRLARKMGQALQHGASGVMGGPARVNAGPVRC